ncbi:hypothetical protein GCM10007860_06890 [Chitiniphilus shinanonensis]|uniref:Peptidase C80 domain-containing protein n=2 Tax=Chitiniphilus shinanonensis TaxID=553088 RepID=A0ABQ6BQ33_9NEIS|nr:hypothetical protein GCM10007860_06890 [Chitiniphilus shinanonensis]
MDSGKRQKAAFYWAHEGGGDIFEQAAGSNLPRIRKAAQDPTARGPVPVIARNETVFADLSAAKQQTISNALSEMTSIRKSIADTGPQIDTIKQTRRRLKAMDPNYVKGQPYPENPQPVKPRLTELLQQTTALKQNARNQRAQAQSSLSAWQERHDAFAATEIKHAGDVGMASLHPQHTKLYVLGHGNAGYDALQTTPDDGVFALTDVAKGLKQSGLNPDFESIRMTSCHSADAVKPTHFLADPPAIHDGARAPAQTLANALKAEGFTQPKVTGYQGQGINIPPGTTITRRIESGDPNPVKRSTVAKVFTPEK